MVCVGAQNKKKSGTFWGIFPIHAKVLEICIGFVLGRSDGFRHFSGSFSGKWLEIDKRVWGKLTANWGMPGIRLFFCLLISHFFFACVVPISTWLKAPAGVLGPTAMHYRYVTTTAVVAGIHENIPDQYVVKMRECNTEQGSLNTWQDVHVTTRSRR